MAVFSNDSQGGGPLGWIGGLLGGGAASDSTPTSLLGQQQPSTGLLGNGPNDPKSAANMALFSSMIAGNLPAGLNAYAQIMGPEGQLQRAKLAEAQLNMLATKLSIDRQQGWLNMLNGDGGGGQTARAPDAPDAIKSPGAFMPPAVDGVGPTAPMSMAPPSLTQSAQQGWALGLPGRSDAQSKMLASTMTPEKYMEVFANQTAPSTDIEKLLISQGVQRGSPLWNQTIQQGLQKATYIAPTSIRPGGWALDRNGNATQYPSAPPGFINQSDGQGGFRTVRVPGALPAITESTAASELGKAEATPSVAYDETTGQPRFSTKALDLARANGGAGQPGAQITNPGNMRPPGASTGFATFATPQEGLAALDNNLQAYGKRGLNTISSIISTWAPPSENDTASYVADVSKRLGVSPSQPLDMSNPIVRQALSTAITLHEQGPSKVFAASAPSQASGGLVPQMPPGLTTGAETRQKDMANIHAGLLADNAQNNTVISRLQNIRQLAPTAITGVEGDRRDYFNGLLSLAGMQPQTDAKTASDLVDKNAAQIVSAIRMGQGGGGTDALQTLVGAANPNRHMTPAAIQEAADQLIASRQMSGAKAAHLNSAYLAGDPVAYGTKALQFDQNADPRLWQLQNMSPDQQAAYVKALPPGVAKDLSGKLQNLASAGAIKGADSLTQLLANGGGGASAQPPNLLATLPPANSSNSGKFAIDHDTGKRYRSNGLQWVELK